MGMDNIEGVVTRVECVRVLLVEGDVVYARALRAAASPLGLLVRLGTGSLALTFAATVTNRWFVARRGMVSGVLTSASMFGGMVVLPLLAWIVKHHAWRPAGRDRRTRRTGAASGGLATTARPSRRPGDEGLRSGRVHRKTRPRSRRALTVLHDTAKTRPFWLLVGTYGVCGASTNGIMMTHFVPAAHEVGVPITVAASLLAVMGVFNAVGATGSGWFTDRFNPRWLLAIYYALRGISLVGLPLSMASTVQPPMLVFVVGYGLLDLATVPPHDRALPGILRKEERPRGLRMGQCGARPRRRSRRIPRRCDPRRARLLHPGLGRRRRAMRDRSADVAEHQARVAVEAEPAIRLAPATPGVIRRDLYHSSTASAGPVSGWRRRSVVR